MNEVYIFLAKYLVYLLAAWTLVSVWYLRRTHTIRQLVVWVVKISLAMGLTYLLIKAGNFLFPEARPFIAERFTPLIQHPNNPSFPSSHTALAAVLATFMWQLRRDWGVIAFILVALVGFGRVMVGVHYPWDILGGALIGIIGTVLVLKFWPRRLV